MATNGITGREVYLTPEGRDKLRAELEELIEVRRPIVARMIQDAKESGDISDNAAFEDAKHEQGILEGKIQDLEWKLRNAKLIQESHSSAIGLGSRVHLRDASGREHHFTIVGSSEARPTDGRISNESPVGRGLLGHGAGEEIDVRLPNDRRMVYTIVAIE